MTSHFRDTTLVPVIAGPTAVGKTAVALELADEHNFEIVSCDSRQIYKHLEIGTAKPTAAELRGKPYRLIDYVEPDRLYSAALYRSDAIAAIGAIFESGRIPIIVAGSGLYLRALTTGFFATPDPDYDYRRELNELSSSALHARLASVDPNTASRIPFNNRQRVIRALEIIHLTGKTASELAREGRYPENMFRYAIFLLSRSRENLYQLINSRVDKMIRDGLIEEVRSLQDRGYGNSPVLAKTVGYKEVLDFFDGRLDQSGCIKLIKQHSRNYAKRQETWFRGICEKRIVNLEDKNWREKLTVELDKLKLDTSSG